MPWGREKKKHGFGETLMQTREKKCLSIDPSLISSNIFYRGGGELVNLVVTPFIFQSNIFIFLPREKEKVAALWRTKKKEGRGEGKGVYTRRVDVYSRVVDTKKNVANEKKKENIYCRGCVLTLCIYIFMHTHTHSFALISWHVFHVVVLS